MLVSIIVPIYNEERSIQEMVERVEATFNPLKEGYQYEIIFINDNSSDGSLPLIKSYAQRDDKIKYISFSRNFGHQTAVYAGIEKCKGDVAIIIDGDLQDPPEVIVNLLEKHKEGCKIVNAKRTSRKGENGLKKITAKIFYRFLSLVTSFEIPVDTGDFRLIDKQVIYYLKQMPEQNRYIRGQISWIGFKQADVWYQRDARKYGKTSYTYKKMFNLALDAVTAFSNFPIRMVTFMGLLVFGLSLVVIVYAFYSYFILHRVITGWTSLIVSTMFIGGVQLLCIGIIGQYISRINTDVRQRPPYIVEETNL